MDIDDEIINHLDENKSLDKKTEILRRIRFESDTKIRFLTEDNRDLVFELIQHSWGKLSLELTSHVKLNNFFISKEDKDNDTLDYIGARRDLDQSLTFDRIRRKSN